MRSGGTTPRASSAGSWRVGRVAGVPFAAGVVAAGLALAGCSSGGAEPTPSVTWTAIHESPWPTPTPTPTPADPSTVPPERPAAMDTVDFAGAEAAAVYFLELVPYANATGDTTELESLSHPECGFCRSVLDGVEQLVAAGQRTVGGSPSITLVNSLEADPGKWWSVDVDLVQEPQQVLDSSGAVVRDVEESAGYHMDVAVVRDGDRWLVRAVDHQQITEGGA